ncbi:MAG: InlB B-repeat-containing protein [Bifidobacterium bifidum]
MPAADGSLYPSWDKALTADITVYAHWERADTQVMYDANGGKGSHAPTDGHQHSTIAMPSDVSRSFSRDGYSFAGWNTKPDGSGVSYKDGDGVPVEDRARHPVRAVAGENLRHAGGRRRWLAPPR